MEQDVIGGTAAFCLPLAFFLICAMILSPQCTFPRKTRTIYHFLIFVVFLLSLQEGAHLFSLILHHPDAAIQGFWVTLFLSFLFAGPCFFLLPLFLVPVYLVYLLPCIQIACTPKHPSFSSVFSCLILLPGMQKALPVTYGKLSVLPAVLGLLLLFFLQRSGCAFASPGYALPLLQRMQPLGEMGHSISVLILYAGVLMRSACAWRIQNALWDASGAFLHGARNTHTGA